MQILKAWCQFLPKDKRYSVCALKKCSSAFLAKIASFKDSQIKPPLKKKEIAVSFLLKGGLGGFWCFFFDLKKCFVLKKLSYCKNLKIPLR